MKKSSVIICTLVLTVLLFASNSFAIGLGLYIDYGSGAGEAGFDVSGADEFDIDTGFLGDELSFSGDGFGLGVAGGANFGVGSRKTILTTTIGMRILYFIGDTEWYDEDEQLNGYTTEFFFSVGFLF